MELRALNRLKALKAMSWPNTSRGITPFIGGHYFTVLGDFICSSHSSGNVTFMVTLLVAYVIFNITVTVSSIIRSIPYGICLILVIRFYDPALPFVGLILICVTARLRYDIV